MKAENFLLAALLAIAACAVRPASGQFTNCTNVPLPIAYQGDKALGLKAITQALREAEIPIDTSDTDLGIITSGWLANPQNVSCPIRFHFRVTDGQIDIKKQRRADRYESEILGKMTDTSFISPVMTDDPLPARVRELVDGRFGDTSLTAEQWQEQVRAQAAERERLASAARAAAEEAERLRETATSSAPKENAPQVFERWSRAAPNCSGPDVEVLTQEIAKLESGVANACLTDIIVGPNYHGGEALARELHVSFAFAVADEALRQRCLDVADRIYRRVVEFYVGSAYSGIRDRARIGIDDVREARRK